MTAELDPNLTGAAFDLANAGYTAMPESRKRNEEEISGDSASLREAADHMAEPRDELVVRQYCDTEGKPAAANEAVTLSRAARDYAGVVAAERLAAVTESAEELAARVDALRAEALAGDPEAADLYGFDLPETASPQEGTEEPSGEPGRPGEDELFGTELDPELERLLQHPQVRQAIEEEIAEVDKARQSYLEGLAAATQVAQASFISQFPELVGLSEEQLPGALEQMARQDPAKFARVQSMIGTTEQLLAQQHEEGRRREEVARQNFLTFAQSEDARFDAMVKAEPKETQQAVMQEILASAKASGIDHVEFMHLFNSEPLMRNATFQRMMYDAGKYRLMMKARDAAAARPLPPVQRPGTATARTEREHADLRTLSARLSNSGDIKDAVALYHARKVTRR